jgi:hypothetical protein
VAPRLSRPSCRRRQNESETNMNSIHSQKTDEIADSSDLVRALKLMTPAFPWEDRAAAAIDFLETQKK